VNQANTQLEIALLFLLCSPESDICSLASQCLGHLCAEAEIIGVEESRSILSVADNFEVYKELSSSDVVVTGRAAQQKRIRRLLRKMTAQTEGN